MEAIDQIVSRSLRSFLDFVNREKWTGRENEAVSLYAFGFLQRECCEAGPLTNPTQIGIEVGAADAPKKSPKSQVRKDLVIWRRPAANRWYPKVPRSKPLAIIEWKVRRGGSRLRAKGEADIEWLASHCSRQPDTAGYTVLLNLSTQPAKLAAVRVTAKGSRELKI